METDAKGQLGGLDTSEAERRQYAEGSSVWRCATCGRSNGEILKDCEDAARAKEATDGEASAVEEKVPEELVIGSKEDLELQSRSGEQVKEKEGEDTEAELAEGFVQTLPAQERPYPAAQPVQGVPRPTGSHTSQSLPAQQGYNQAPITTRRTQIQQHVSSDGVPLWVDRAIAGIVICLVIMILKMLLGL